eukprot:COSAG02_NODE_859_length_16438_cov_11.496236_10_plen_120_part_00
MPYIAKRTQSRIQRLDSFHAISHGIPILPRSVEAEFVSHHTYKSLTVNSVLISVKLGVEVCESRLAHTGTSTGCHAAGDDDDALAVGAERAMLGARDGRSAQPARNYVVAEQPENGMRR